jgi:hypothetical protein
MQWTGKLIGSRQLISGSGVGLIVLIGVHRTRPQRLISAVIQMTHQGHGVTLQITENNGIIPTCPADQACK